MSLSIKQSRAAFEGDADAGLMGDPGIFGFVGKVAKKAVGVGISILPGPIGGIARAGRAALRGRGAPAGVGRQVDTISPRRSRPGVGVRIPRFRTPFSGGRSFGGGGGGRSLDIRGPGGIGVTLEEGAPVGTAVVEGSMGQPVPACPQGMRPNKSDYFRRSPAGGVVFIRKGTVCVSTRRRNALNPRALDRAIGRVVSAKKAAKKLGTITVRKTCP